MHKRKKYRPCLDCDLPRPIDPKTRICRSCKVTRMSEEIKKGLK